MTAWPFVARAGGVDPTSPEGAMRLDMAILILAGIGVAGLAMKALSDARRLAVEQ